jgi:hypothetical protein
LYHHMHMYSANKPSHKFKCQCSQDRRPGQTLGPYAKDGGAVGVAKTLVLDELFSVVTGSAAAANISDDALSSLVKAVGSSTGMMHAVYQHKYNLAPHPMVILSAGLQGMERDQSWVYNGMAGTAGAHVEDAGNLHFFNLALLVRLDLTGLDEQTSRVVLKILDFCRKSSKVWIFLPSRCV